MPCSQYILPIHATSGVICLMQEEDEGNFRKSLNLFKTAW